MLPMLARSSSMQGSAFPYLLFSNNSSILPRSPDLSSPKFCLGVDGVQRLGHALPSKPLFVRGFFCLYDQDEPKREVQPVRSYPLLPASDQASKFKQGRSEGARPYFWPLGGKDRRDRLVEWVKKASFDRLNKLFEISSSERNHQVFLQTITRSSGQGVQAIHLSYTLPFGFPIPGAFFSFFLIFILFCRQTEPDTKVDLSTTSTEPKVEVEPVVPPINYKEEREEDMVANLRVGFKERQHKRLFESITVISFPSKIPCPEILCPEPVLAIALALVPSTTTTGSNLLVEEAARLALERPSSDLAHLNDDSVEFVASIPSHPLASRGLREQPQYFLHDLTSIRYFGLCCLPHPAHARLHDYRDDESAAGSTLQMAGGVETMRAYIAHNMDGSEKLHAKLKSVEGELAAARKIIDKGARAFPISLKLFSSYFSHVLKDSSEDQGSGPENTWSCLFVVMHNSSLAIRGHLDGRVSSYLIYLIQLPFKLLVVIFFTLYNHFGGGHVYPSWDDNFHSIGKGESGGFCWSS
ncbi:hypothetical protein CK203_100868 [Vitis vinifera]|uniref:Uncharacterized protein n=1 Tax=Vitis vinifera TaxID=29760 RepID=A0A438CZI3_VITVI|nr:hypothetical protein CK203_100868 [Vitis vinifera]